MAKKSEQLPAVVPTPQDPARVHQVVRWVVSGATEYQIVESIRATWPEQDAAPLIVEALADITRNGELDKKLIRGFCFESARDVYRRAVEAGDFGSALRALKQIEGLAG